MVSQKGLEDGWLISGLVGCSMALQLLLLVSGGSRKWRTWLRYTAWLSYSTADVVAILALGAMSRAAAPAPRLYAVWAPMLLMHLGGPDNISAHSRQDAELWRRHALVMLSQLLTAAYVCVRSARGLAYNLVSSALFVVGSIKYAERTLALRSASTHRIVRSAQPLYILMPRLDARLRMDQRAFNYIVAGEQQLDLYSWQPVDVSLLVTVDQVLSKSSQELRHQRPLMELCIAFALFKMYLRRLTNLCMHEYYDPKIWSFFSVAIARYDNSASSNDGSVHLSYGPAAAVCTAEHSLHETAANSGTLATSFTKDGIQMLINILDMELRFLFDSLYTKAGGTAYTVLGALLRIVSIALLCLASVCIFRAMKFHDRQLVAAVPVTYTMLTLGLLIELYQLLRLLLSDWTRVALACMFVRNARNNTHSIRERAKSRVSLVALRLVGKLWNRHRYWTSKIGQYDLLEEAEQTLNYSMCSHMAASMYEVLSRCLNVHLMPTVWKYERVEGFKESVISRVLERCVGFLSDGENVVEKLKRCPGESILGPEGSLAGLMGRSSESDTAIEMKVCKDLQLFIMVWHIATCRCWHLRPLARRHMRNDADGGAPEGISDGTRSMGRETESSEVGGGVSMRHGNGSDEEESPEMSRRVKMTLCLSKYMAYILVAKPHMLPCNAAAAMEAYRAAKQGVLQLNMMTNVKGGRVLVEAGSETTVMSMITRRSVVDDDGAVLGRVVAGVGVRVAERLVRQLGGARAWEVLWEGWVDVAMCVASAHQGMAHVEELTAGSEFLTHLWLLMGHIGAGAQGAY